MNKVKISIIFLTFNGLKDHFRETYKAVLNQNTDLAYEIIAIDSGSSDGTVEFIKSTPRIRLYEIPNSQFSHSRTRQLGAQLAKGKYLVFLTQDATPTNRKWLDSLIKNFKDFEVVGVCSRIIPRLNACLLRKIEVNNDLSGRTQKIIAQIKNKEGFEALNFSEKRKNYYFFNDISSAIRRNFIMQNPFPVVEFAEDVEFAKIALNKEKKVVFEPDSIVYHSHSYEIIKTYKRNLVDSTYHKENLGIKNVPTLKSVFLNVIMLIRRDISEIGNYEATIGKKIGAIIYSPIIHFFEQWGQYRGTK